LPWSTWAMIATLRMSVASISESLRRPGYATAERVLDRSTAACEVDATTS
jgi:hypothetical protein